MLFVSHLERGVVAHLSPFHNVYCICNVSQGQEWGGENGNRVHGTVLEALSELLIAQWVSPCCIVFQALGCPVPRWCAAGSIAYNLAQCSYDDGAFFLLVIPWCFSALSFACCQMVPMGRLADFPGRWSGMGREKLVHLCYATRNCIEITCTFLLSFVFLKSKQDITMN